MNEVKKHARGLYGIYIGGELVTCARNPQQAQEKLAKELRRIIQAA